jgi:hypothetical protein
VSKRLRPSLRKLEKAELAAQRAAQPGAGFLSTFEVRRAAERAVLARLSGAMDRINVASQFDESGGTPAQLQHAARWIREGFEEPEPLTRFGFAVDARRADEIVVILSDLFHDAYVAELMERAARRELAAVAAGEVSL